MLHLHTSLSSSFPCLAMLLMQIKCIWKSQSRQHKGIIRHCACSNKQMNCRVWAVMIPPAASLNNTVPSIQVSAKLIKYFVTTICQGSNENMLYRAKLQEACLCHGNCAFCTVSPAKSQVSSLHSVTLPLRGTKIRMTAVLVGVSVHKHCPEV